LHAHDPKLRPPVDEDESLLQEASSELARAIWQTVLLSRDDAKSRGLIGKATRRKLVDQILKLARAARGR